MALRVQTEGEILLWIKLSLVGEMLLAGNWLLFSITFGKVNFKTTLKKWKWVLPIAYLFPGVLIVSLLTRHQAMMLEHPRIITLGAIAAYFAYLLVVNRHHLFDEPREYV